LRKGKIETSLEFNYLTSGAFLQTDRVWTASTTLRYGIIDGLEISAALPYYNSVRTTSTGPARAISDPSMHSVRRRWA